MNTGCFFLVTRKVDMIDYHYLDSLQIEGLFYTEKDANKRVEECKARDERIKNDPYTSDWEKEYIYTYTVTEMYPNQPFKDNEYKQYPSSWYEE